VIGVGARSVGKNAECILLLSNCRRCERRFVLVSLRRFQMTLKREDGHSMDQPLPTESLTHGTHGKRC